jgi:ribosomal-protein-alanine N-acetyltransferase
MPQMTSALDTQLTFMPMQPSDMRAVMPLEAISHSHPWTQGNFLDSLTAGHWAYCIRPEMTAKAELAANLPALLEAKTIFMASGSSGACMNVRLA